MDRIDKIDDAPRLKRSYVSPSLVFHGAITDLAMAGSGPVVETGTQPTCQNNTNRKPCPPASDVRLKDSIRRVGQYSENIGLYLFEYKPEFKETCGEGTYLGVMAQEVLPILPSAVVTAANGYYAVDYAQLRQLRH